MEIKDKFCSGRFSLQKKRAASLLGEAALDIFFR